MDSWDYCSPAKLIETWLAITGEKVNLVTSGNEAEFDHDAFCVDHVNSAEGEVVALICNPCTEENKNNKHCLNLCCPHGLATTRNGCVPHNQTVDWNPEFWSGSDSKHAKQRNKDYVLKAPGRTVDGFQCPNSRDLQPVETDLGGKFQLQLNGTLKATYLPNNKQNQSSTVLYESNEFCLYFGEDPYPDYGDYPENGDNATGLQDSNAYEDGTSNGDVRRKRDVTALEDGTSGDVTAFGFYQEYMYCMEEEEKTTSVKITKSLYPWALGISCFFLALTLIALIMEPDLRKGLFGRITLGFVCNLFIGYILLSFVHNNDPPLNTRACVAAGYLTQYSFLAFFFWINAMALNIFLKFSMSKFKKSSRSEVKKFWWYFLYAQGLPLVICCITALVDHFGTKSACGKIDSEMPSVISENDTLSLPNMGTYNCFLGAGHYASEGSYFAHPAFIYFQSFLIIIQILNIAFFVITVHNFNKHWKESKGLNKNTDNSSYDNLFVVIKLFVIMGVTWIFEFIGGWIEFNHSSGQWWQDHGFVIRVIMDLPNLFQGFLIFLVLVCKKKTVLSLKAKITGTSLKKDMSTTSTVKTRSTSGAQSEGIPLEDYPQK